ncbi:hypothetical protein ACIRST_39110, partial [Kitasatospora sp. NPDC101447]
AIRGKVDEITGGTYKVRVDFAAPEIPKILCVTCTGKLCDLCRLKNAPPAADPDGAARDPAEFDYVVVANGFTRDWWVPKLSEEAGLVIESIVGGPLQGDAGRRLARHIGPGLEIMGLYPRLHLPMFAEVQGPGFGSLHSLGLLSDRILSPNCDRPVDYEGPSRYR